MKRYILFLLVVMLALVIVPAAAQDETPRQGIRPDAPPYAIRGPYAVGTMDFTIEPDSDRPLVTTAWYPALNPDGLEESVVYTFFADAPMMTAPGRAIRDAEPNTAEGPYPLILLSHGGSGSRFISPYLTEHLASRGFVVLAMDHAGGTMLDTSSQFYEQLYQRPLDITRTIDAAEEMTADGGLLAGLIDTEYIGLTGASFGGYATLATAQGSHFSLSDFQAICDKYSRFADQCTSIFDNLEAFVAQAGLDNVPEDLLPSWGDPRIDAIMPMVPAFMGAESVKTITIPALLILGSLDSIAPNDVQGYRVWENLGSGSKTLVEFMSAGHVFPVLKCADVPWAGFAWWCADPVWDMDRAHDLVDHFATAFFLSQFKGDADAAAALAPVNVQFPGIRYETTGY